MRDVPNNPRRRATIWLVSLQSESLCIGRVSNTQLLTFCGANSPKKSASSLGPAVAREQRPHYCTTHPSMPERAQLHAEPCFQGHPRALFLADRHQHESIPSPARALPVPSHRRALKYGMPHLQGHVLPGPTLDDDGRLVQVLGPPPTLVAPNEHGGQPQHPGRPRHRLDGESEHSHRAHEGSDHLRVAQQLPKNKKRQEEDTTAKVRSVIERYQLTKGMGTYVKVGQAAIINY